MNQTETKEVALAPKPHHVTDVYIPSQSDWNFMVQWGKQAIMTGMLPPSIKSAEAAAIIILKGRELGLSFMTSIAHIHVVNGKPTMSAELIQGLARKNLPGLVINIIESDDRIAEIEFIRPERGSKAFRQKFTMDQAIVAKLTNKDVWKQYPAAMLWSRAVTAGLRKVCPEALMGISYTPEEMGANVDGDGNVIETTGKTIVDKPIPPVIPPVEKPIEPKPVIVIKPKDTDPELPQSPPLSEDPDSAAKKAEGYKVKGLKMQLALTDDQLKEELFKEFKTESWVSLTLSQMKAFTAILEQHRENMNRMSPPIEQSSDPESFNNFQRNL